MDKEAFERTKSIFDLSGRVAIITGAAGGLGQIITLALATFGAIVVLTSRNFNNLKKLEKKYITFTGGMEVNDGMQLIPFAAQEILKKHPDSVFMLVGEGKGVDQLMKLVKDLHLMFQHHESS